VIVHLVEFRIKPGFEAEVVASLYQAAAGGSRPEGLLAHSVGRRLGESHRRHILACAWRDLESWQRGLDEGNSPMCLSRVAERLQDRHESVIDVVASAGPSWEEGRVLRVYRARVHSESLTEWEARARGPVAWLANRPGLVSITVGPTWPRPESDGDRVVFAISAWLDWSDVLAATGGRIHGALQRTELADLERPLGAQHYELLAPPLSVG
jgi:heme-degrading monooxygenase HmoA